MPDALEKEFDWYLSNKAELVKKYDGRVIVIKDCMVIGDYGDIGIALKKTSQEHTVGTFLVQKCSLGDQDTTAIFHSRVA